MESKRIGGEKMRNKLIVLMFFMMLFIVGLGSALPTNVVNSSGTLYVTDCTELNESGTYVLQDDIILVERQVTNCFDITANNVVLDLNGKIVDAVDSEGYYNSGYGVYVTGSGCTVKNGEIKYFGGADSAGGIGLQSSGNNISGVTLTGGYYGVEVGSGNNLENVVLNGPNVGLLVTNYNNFSNLNFISTATYSMDMQAAHNNNFFGTNNFDNVVFLHGDSMDNNFYNSTFNNQLILYENSDRNYFNNIVAANVQLDSDSGAEDAVFVNSVINLNVPNYVDASFVDTTIGDYSIPAPSNLSLENDYGKIEFTDGVYGSGLWLFGGDSDIKISNNNVFVYSENIPGLNKSANVTLYNVSTDMVFPWPVKDGGLACPVDECSMISYNVTSGDISFSVSNWGAATLSAQSSFAGGDGTYENPYQISSWTQLNNMRLNLSASYILTANLSFSDSDYTGIGDSWVPIGNVTAAYRFSGSFDGDNHIISDLVINQTANNYTGFFGYLSGNISHLGLVDIEVTSAGVGGNGNVGGFAAVSSGGVIHQSYVTGTVLGAIEDCSQGVGGLVGNGGVSIDSSYSLGVVAGCNNAGGLVGTGNSIVITNSYSGASVSSGNGAGGLVGVGWSGSITNSYSTGEVFCRTPETYCSEYFGGLSSLFFGEVTNSYWDIETSGQATSSVGTGLTTAEMKKMAPFLLGGGWDISQGEDLNNGYPYLAWQASNNSYVWLTPAEIPFVGGDGSSGDPYQIGSWIGLDAMRYDDLDANYILAANLSSGSANYTGLGDSWVPVGDCGGDGDCGGTEDNNPFVGNFDGQNNTISDLTISGVVNYRGLFGYLNGNISNIGLINVNISGDTHIGSLAGYSIGIINNSYSVGRVLGYNTIGGLVGSQIGGVIDNSFSLVNISTMASVVGGLVGYSTGTISNSYSGGNLSGDVQQVGGLVGMQQSGVISNSYSTSLVFANSASGVGGLVGQASGAIISCYSLGNVNSSGNDVGGLIGFFDGTINNSYATGNVTAGNGVGGLVGGQYAGLIHNSYSTGKIVAVGDFGGLVGSQSGGVINNSYWDINTSGQATSAVGTGLNTTQMQMQSSFVNWSFAGTWIIDDGNDYPKLRFFFKPPILISSVQTPSNIDALDPSVFVEMNSILLNQRGDFDSAWFEWKNSSQSWNEANRTLINISIINSSISANSSFTLPIYEDNVFYRIYVNNSLGEGIHYTYNISSFWDCTWNATPISIGSVAGYNFVGANPKQISNVTLNNTGDASYSGGCNIVFSGFATTPSGHNLTTQYMVAPPYGGRQYLRFKEDGAGSFITYSSPATITVAPNSSKLLSVYADYPERVLIENPYFTITSSENDSINNRKYVNVTARLVVTPGAYLETVVESPTTNQLVYLRPQNLSLSAYAKNVADGRDSPNNTAYDFSFNLSVPSVLSSRFANNFSVDNLTYFNATVNTTDKFTMAPIVEFTAANLETLTSDELSIATGIAFVSISSSASGYENSTGNLTLIRTVANQTIFNSSVNIILSCVTESDGYKVPACGALDGDYVAPSAPDTSGSSGGGGGGGGGGGSFDKSSATFSLIRGESQEFELTLDNKLDFSKSRIKIAVTGNNSQYVSVDPKVIDYLGPKSSSRIKVIIDAPSYFASGKFLLQFEFRGFIEGNTSTPFTEVKYITLEILEMSKEEASGLVNKSIVILDEMTKSGLYLDDVQNILDQMKSNYDSLNYNSLREASKKISEIYTAATESVKLMNEINASIIEAEKNGVSVPETKKLLYLAQIIFNRGDYINAYAKLKEAKSSLLLETKGEFNLLYAIKNKPIESLGILISLSLVGLGSGYLLRWRLLRRKLSVLVEEEKLLLELMKVVQRDCFEKNKLSMEEYTEAMNQYENRLGEIIQEKVTTETQLANINKLRGRKKALLSEKIRLTDLVRSAQDDYMNKAKLDTRVYGNMLRSYATRLSGVQEELAYIEAQDDIRRMSGFWARLFRKS